MRAKIGKAVKGKLRFERDYDYLDDLYKQGKMAELVLVSWGAIETYVDILMSLEYGLSLSDERAELLSDFGYQKKLDFLKKRGKIDGDQYKVIHAFQQRRNDIFHKTISGRIFEEDSSEKKEIMDLARGAAKAAGRA